MASPVLEVTAATAARRMTTQAPHAPQPPACSLFRWIALGVLVHAVVTMISAQISTGFSVGFGLSDVAEPGVEADVVRAGDGFARRGLTRNVGLPDVAYGDQYAGLGSEANATKCPSKDACVELTVPPLPYWIAGVVAKLSGLSQLPALRLVTLSLGAASLVTLALALVHTVGVIRAAIAFYLFRDVAMVTAAMHGASHHGYVISLLLLEVALVLRLARATDADARRRHPRLLAGLAIIGFAQGLLSYDFVFLVAAAPLATGLLFHDMSDRGAMRLLGAAALAATVGFVAAHMIHASQVAAWLGSVSEAAAHFKHVAVRNASAGEWGRYPFPGVAGLLVWYLTVLVPAKTQLGVGPVALCLAAALGAAGGAQSRQRHPSSPAEALDAPGSRTVVRVFGVWFELSPRRRYALAIAVALVASCAWIVVMRAHATAHTAYLPRHMVLTYVIGVLAILLPIKADVEVPVGVAPRKEGMP